MHVLSSHNNKNTNYNKIKIRPADTRTPDIEGIGVCWYEDRRSTISSKQKIRIILVQAPW